MARLDALPDLDIIRGLKGTIDFYLWRGLPCARAWPRYRPARQTDASKAAALLFGAVIKAFSLTAGAVLEQLDTEAAGIPRTPRDIYVSGVYGNLHEASMSDFLDLLTECRDFLSALTQILNALDSIDTDELVVNVDESALPAGAATAANQATAITALQKLDDLQDALQSKDLDRLLVRGQDQLFTYKEAYTEYKADFNAAAGDNYMYFAAVPAGQVWTVNHISAQNSTTLCSIIQYGLFTGAANRPFHDITPTLLAKIEGWQCRLTLEAGQTAFVKFSGCVLNDDLRIWLHCTKMTKET